MSKTGTMRVTVKPGDTLPRGKTDWARLDAMTDEEVLAAARSDSDAQPFTPEQLAKMRRVSRVKASRYDAVGIRSGIPSAHYDIGSSTAASLTHRRAHYCWPSSATPKSCVRGGAIVGHGAAA